MIKFIRNAYNSFRQTETLLDRKQLNFIRPYLGQLQLSDDEQRLVELSRNKIRRKNIANWISLLFVMIVLLAAGFYWQYSKFTSFKQKADEYMDEAMYTEAKIEYNRALNVPVPFKQAAVDSSAKCDYYLGLKPKYDSLIAEGNAFFSLGINNYQNAFDRYNSAYNLHYNTEGIEEIISGKKEDALIKYSELANLEAAEGHVDIALAHLARANALEKSTTIQKQFLSLISKLNTDQVREAARKLKVEEDLVPLVLELINDAQNADGNENALRLLRNTLTT